MKCKRKSDWAFFKLTSSKTLFHFDCFNVNIRGKMVIKIARLFCWLYMDYWDFRTISSVRQKCRYSRWLYDIFWLHRMTMTSFAVTLYGQCCQCHVVGQGIVCNVTVIRSCWIFCGLCSDRNNTNPLLLMFIAVLGTSILLQIQNLAWSTTWRRVLGDHR